MLEAEIYFSARTSELPDGDSEGGSWKIGQDLPFSITKLERATRGVVFAYGVELEYILSRFRNLPSTQSTVIDDVLTPEAKSMYFYGDMALHILGNLR